MTDLTESKKALPPLARVQLLPHRSLVQRRAVAGGPQNVDRSIISLCREARQLLIWSAVASQRCRKRYIALPFSGYELSDVRYSIQGESCR
jgi:hypothetical protein